MTVTVRSRTEDRYPSRVGATPQVIPRRDPVVYPGADAPLDPDLVQSFEDDGFIVLAGLIPPASAAKLNRELDRLAADPSFRRRSECVVEAEADELRSVFAIHRIAGPLRAITRAPGLVSIARHVVGDDVYLHQTRAYLKAAFRGKEFYWHSDFETWHAEDGMPAPRAVSCSVLLTPNHPWNGPLLTIAGSHQWFVSCVGDTPEDHYEASLRRQEIGTPDDDSLRDLAERGRIAQMLGPVGTVVFFDSNLMHGSGSNITPDPRRNLFMVYNAASNALVEPFAAPSRRPEFVASRTFEPL